MLTRWKLLACSLTVGVGGLAVFADPPADNKKDTPPEPPPLPKLTVKPDSPPNGTDTPAPPPGSKPSPGLEFDLDLPPAPTKPIVPKPEVLPDLAAPPAPPVILPVKGEAGDKKPADKKDPPKSDPDALPPPPDLKAPPAPPIPEIKTPVAPPPPLIPEVKTPVAPPPAIKPVDTKPVAVPGITHAPAVEPEPARIPPPTAPIAPATKAEGAKLKMLLRMGDGNPRFEIRNTATTELLLKVYGEKIELQAPTAGKSSLAGVSAAGKVRFTAPGIEGHCDTLKILSATGEVLLEGNIRLKSRGGKAWSELTAEKMVYQIGNAGLVPTRPAVRPVGFTQE